MNNNRQQEALDVRIAAAKLAANRPHQRHVANDDETKFRREKKDSCNPSKSTVKSEPTYLANFTKGLPHDYNTGLVLNAADYQQFVKGIDSGDPRDFQDTPLGPKDFDPDPHPEVRAKFWYSQKAKDLCEKQGAMVRAWESQGAGNNFSLEGPDAQAVTMPPAPAIGSDELIAEMGEVYAQALLRDVPFTEIVDESGQVPCDSDSGDKSDTSVSKVLALLNKLAWFSDDDCCNLNPAELSRKRIPMTGRTVFRGITFGDDVGPYISQFLLAGNGGINAHDEDLPPIEGFISYGAIRIDQRVRFATPCKDYMQNWNEWYDVQQGADLRDKEEYEDVPKRRFITTPRDLATYVHYDALYEAYLNACLLLLGIKAPFDPGIPFQAGDHDDHQQGFAQFGGPHILSLVTEVATRALKAVRFQKFNVHRRLRPEALAARLAKYKELDVPEVTEMAKQLKGILSIVDAHNGPDKQLKNGNFLLPMAFREGSPMHPSYGAGHATVAGACVTILKAFFDHKHPLSLAVKDDPSRAFVAEYDPSSTTKSKLTDVAVVDKDGKPASLTVEGELNKLASNISIGRDWAGVHYFSDYIESLRMGEQIAIGILEEQKLTYGENFSMTVPLYDGGSIRI
ncbi:MAG: vanadium-dependent haloperoxidase [Chloroflexota bacterium]